MRGRKLIRNSKHIERPCREGRERGPDRERAAATSPIGLDPLISLLFSPEIVLPFLPMAAPGRPERER
jgi:hypothetical protein